MFKEAAKWLEIYSATHLCGFFLHRLWKRKNKNKKGVSNMAKKDDAVAAGVAAIESGVEAALGSFYDGAFADGVASVPASGGISADQEASDIAAQVALAVAPLNDQLASVQADDAAKTQVLATAKALQDQLAVLFPPAPVANS